MTLKLMKTCWVLAVPLALALVTSAAHAGAQQDPQATTATKKVTTTKSGNTVTRDTTVTQPNGKTATRHATTVKEGNTVTRDATTVGPNGGVTVAHSVAEWHPETRTKTTQTTRTTTRPAEPKRKHWWQHSNAAKASQPAEEVRH